MKKTSFIYDSEANSLLVFREDRINHYHMRMEEIIIGFDKDMRLSSVEILNPDKLYGITKKRLRKLSSARISANCRGSMLMIFVALEMGKVDKERIPVSVPLREPIPRVGM